jgi:hypothetical protein
MHAETHPSIRFIVLAILAGVVGIALLASGLRADRAGAGLEDATSARAWIVPTANNPDIDPNSSCAGPQDISDSSQPQSPGGSAANAVTVGACAYLSGLGGPKWTGPGVFETDGPGGLLCQPNSTQLTARCAFDSPNAPNTDFQVRANNQAGVHQPEPMRVRFCADDPPADGLCTSNDEEGANVTIDWEGEDGAPPPDGGPGPGPLSLDLKAKKQKLKKKIKFSATATVTSTLVAKGKKIKTTTKELVANQKTKVKAKLKRKAKKKLAKKLKKKGKAKVKVEGTATTQSGATATDTVKVKLKD